MKAASQRASVHVVWNCLNFPPRPFRLSVQTKRLSDSWRYRGAFILQDWFKECLWLHTLEKQHGTKKGAGRWCSYIGYVHASTEIPKMRGLTGAGCPMLKPWKAKWMHHAHWHTIYVCLCRFMQLFRIMIKSAVFEKRYWEVCKQCKLIKRYIVFYT